MPRSYLIITLLLLSTTSDAGMMGGGMRNGGMMGSQSSPAEPPAKNADPEIRKGYRLTQQYCSACHQAPNPVQHTAADWPLVLSRMQAYMHQQHRHAPDTNEQHLILEYLGKSGSGHK